MDYQFAIETEGLTKRYRTGAAINNLTLSIPKGEVVGILGQNGAGKSTLLRMIIGAVKPTVGVIKVMGNEVGHPEFRHRIGYLPDECPLQDFLTAHQLLTLHGSLAEIPGWERGAVIATALDRLGVSGNDRIGEMSRGTRQRLGIAMAALNSPDLVILDEPTAALDQAGRAIVRNLLRDLASDGCTVLVSSHLLTEIERSCSRIIILNRGVVIADGSVASLTKFKSRIDIEVTALNAGAVSAINKICTRVDFDPSVPTRFTAYVKNKSDSAAIAAALVANGVGLISLKPRMETVEELFARLTSSE